MNRPAAGFATRRPEEPCANSASTVLWEPGRAPAPATRQRVAAIARASARPPGGSSVAAPILSASPTSSRWSARLRSFLPTRSARGRIWRASAAFVGRVAVTGASSWSLVGVDRMVVEPIFGMITAAAFLAHARDITRFPDSRRLVGYLGLGRRSASSTTPRRAPAASPRKAPRSCATCSSKPHTPPCAAPARCGRSTSASAPAEATRSRTLPQRADGRLLWHLLTSQRDRVTRAVRVA